MLKRLSCLLILLATLIMAGCSPVNAPDPSDSDDPSPGPIVAPLEPEPSPELPAAFMVMIDNHSAARPQHGLDKADVVYEFVCETGITRFLAAFYSQDPIRVGPIRSIRYYYLQVAKPYDVPLVHVGGNMDALNLRKPLGIKSVCAITNAGSTFFVDRQRKRPHATYATSEAVLALAKERSYPSRGLPELPTGEWPDGQEVGEVKIKYSSRYEVSWVYDDDGQCYSRLLNGSPHVTAEQEPIQAQNIIVLEAPVKTVEVPVDGIQSEINVIGQGRALFLREGKLLSGTWHKEKPEAHFQYLLDDGSPVTFAPGNVWVQQVHSLTRDVVYK